MIKMQTKSFFIIEKIKKYRKCPALDLERVIFKKETVACCALVQSEF